MKCTGITRPVDPLGRVTLPKELRETFDLEEKDRLEIYTDGNYILLKKYEEGCVFCGEVLPDDQMIHFGGTVICPACAARVKEALKNA